MLLTNIKTPQKKKNTFIRPEIRIAAAFIYFIMIASETYFINQFF